MKSSVAYRTALVGALAVLTAVPLGATPLPSVYRATATVFAAVTDPQQLAFAPDGTLYVGRDNSGSGGDAMDAVKIHRIGPGGAPLIEFGDQAIPDPDAVVVDAAGVASGIPGAILVAGNYYPGSLTGHVTRISPNGEVAPLLSGLLEFSGINSLARDQTGRILGLRQGPVARVGVVRPTGMIPLAELTGREAGDLAVDAGDRLWLSDYDGTRLHVLTAQGEPFMEVPVEIRLGSPLAASAHPFWGTNVYAITPGGALLSISPQGTTRVRGQGFANATYLTFGPDGSLYVSEFIHDRVVRIAPDPGPTATISVATVNICWNSIEGLRYQVQYRSNLTENQWVDVGPELTGTGGEMCVADAVQPDEKRFYRVKEMPGADGAEPPRNYAVAAGADAP